MIQAIAFDLDDTLLDTTRLLLGLAAKQACEAMILDGLPMTLEMCLSQRSQLAAQNSHKEVFPEIARRSGSSRAKELGNIGVDIFYNATIPNTLPLMDGARNVLNAVAAKYKIYLVTAGAPKTQWEKIKATGLEKQFQDIFVVDKMKNEQKTEAFQKILKLESCSPNRLLSVGNRMAEEIRQAKKLGATTCHFEYGEHAGEVPQVLEDHADFTIHHWAEFISSCRL